jgi:Kef-type K+ transport system membrane component KefB
MALQDIEFSKLLLSLTIILGLSLLFGKIFNLLKMPKVVGEIISGIALGPSLLGFFYPNMHEWLFGALLSQPAVSSLFYWLGLVFLMFTSGLKISFENQQGQFSKIIILIAAGTLPPLILGWQFADFFIETSSSNKISFSLVFAIACAVTSIPVLSRIFLELKLLDGNFAKNILIAAAVQDAILWLILSIALEIDADNSKTFIGMEYYLQLIAIIVLYSGFMLTIAPKIINFLSCRISKYLIDSALIGLIILGCFFSVAAGNLFGINIIFVALLTGILVGKISRGRLNVALNNIQDLSDWFFVPIYFALVGFQVTLMGEIDPFIIIGFFVLSSAVKIISVTGAMRLIRKTWLKALDYGISMNARGGPGIVLASVAYSAGVINSKFFNALIITSIITSLIAGIWLRFRVSSIKESN